MLHSIRSAKPGDLQGILAILNHYIETHHCTFDTTPWTIEQKQPWFAHFSSTGPYQCLVADAAGEVIAYCFSARWRPKAAYDVTAETTVYVSPHHRGSGLGAALMSSLIERLQSSSLHSLVAGITQPGSASNRLHEALGYEVIGTYREAGHKFGRFWDVRWYQKFLD